MFIMRIGCVMKMPRNLSMKHRCLRLFRRCMAYVLVLSSLTFVYMSLEYNLTGYAFLPEPLTALSECAKSNAANLFQTASGSDVSINHVRPIDTGAKYKLVDLPVVELNEVSNPVNENHVILWYNQPKWMDISFGSKSLQDHCPYKNCRMSNNHGNLSDKSAIVFCLTNNLQMPFFERPTDQVWILFWMEPPGKVDRVDRLAYRHHDWRNKINWTMSYRTDSDIFYPYGTLTSRENGSSDKNYQEIYDNKTKFAAWIVSNCHPESRRDIYVNELKDHGIPVDIYGYCGENKDYRELHDLEAMLNKNYKFYFSFENSFCKDYVTEKFFRYYKTDVILVVRGGLNYSIFFPPKSFIDTETFNSSRSLANYLKYVASNRHVYVEYLKEKDKYIANEMFGLTNSFCRMCEKLNHLDENRKMIGDFVPLVHSNQCWYPRDLNTYHRLTGYVTALNCVMVVLLLTGLYNCYTAMCSRRKSHRRVRRINFIF